MTGFNHIEHPENVALALAVCQSLGVKRETALEAMQKAVPDPGALRIWNLYHAERSYAFVNAFAANDPQSTLSIWKMIAGHPALQYESTCAFLNTRSDRPSRTIQLLELIRDEIRPDHLVVRGDRLDRFEREFFSRMGETVSRFPEAIPARTIIQAILEQPDHTLIFGLGNIVGSGFQLLDELKQYRSTDG